MTSAEISGRAMARNELAGALAGWDNEGGSVRSEANAQMVLDEAEERILRCLGAAVIVQWNELRRKSNGGSFSMQPQWASPGTPSD